jgi:alpha-L-fucosidase 2
MRPNSFEKLNFRSACGDALYLRLLLPACIAIFLSPPVSKASTDYQLWYTSPGNIMGTSALPIGNGHIGMWAQCGIPDNDVASLCDGNLYNGDTAGMATFGNFNSVHINYPANSGYSNFKRSLDIGEATLSVSYTANSKDYFSEFIASYPDSCIINHVTCSTPGGISLTVSISGEHPSHSMTVSTTKSASGATLINSGRMNHTRIPAVGIEQRIYVKKLSANGTVSSSGNTLNATNCDSLDIFIAITDQFKHDASLSYVRTSPTAREACSTIVSKASAQTYTRLRARHIADYQSLFNRFSLDLNAPVKSTVPTDQRWANYQEYSGKDNGFMVLMHQYGRYLMISCSRNCLPPGLIGLWDNQSGSGWTGGFYNNINAQMMWGSLETNNLAECAIPFINFINNIRPSLRFHSQTADPGDRGYVCWRISNPYGGSGSQKGYEAGTPWNLHYAYDHFRFDQDTAYLRENIYPNMKEVSQHLIDHQKLWNGKYATMNGESPENGSPPDIATAHDGQTTWDLLTNTLEAATILNDDPAFRDTLATRLAQINDGISHIGPNGDLLEFDNSTGNSAGQRHISHLFCIEPGRQISPILDATKFAAAKKALLLRNPGAWTGWSFMVRARAYARCLMGDSAFKKLDSSLVWNYSPGNMLNHDIDNQSAWQLDGNIGYSAAVPEMLAQSQVGYKIQLLPALPSKWPAGTVQGLRLRNGFVISSMTWSSGKLVVAYIRSLLGKQCKIFGTNYTIVDVASGSLITPAATDGCLAFSTVSGAEYEVVIAGNSRVKTSDSAASFQTRVNICRNQSGKKLFVSVRNNQLKHIDLTIFNGRGQAVVTEHFHSSNLPVTIDISYLATGTYLLQAIADGRAVYSKKINIIK